MSFQPTDDKKSARDQKIQALLDSGQASDPVEAREQVLWEEIREVDPKRDLMSIQDYMRRIRSWGSFEDHYGFKPFQRRSEEGMYRYSEAQIQAGEWSPEDFQRAIQEIAKDRINRLFLETSNRYEFGRPIRDSIVRLDQEREIFDDLQNHVPVLVRGNWRMGKTSMVWSLEKHRYSENQVIKQDVAARGPFDDELPEFRKRFGLFDVSDYLQNSSEAKAESQNSVEDRKFWQEQIKASGKTPFEFLDEWLEEKGERVLVSLDEAIALADKPDKLAYLAELQHLKNISLCIVLHRFSKYEELFSKTFPDFKTYFVRPLSVAEVGAIVRQPLQNTNIEFTDEAIQRIYAITGGRPMEVNHICRALLDPFSEITKMRFIYRAEDVDALSSRELWDLEGVFRVELSNYEKVYSHSMSNEERSVVDRLISEGEVPVSEWDVALVKPLIDTTFVAEDKEKGVYRINGELFRRVVEDILNKKG